MIKANNSTSTNLRYNILDTYSIENSSDTRVAILKRVQYRTTKDGKPFIRALFEDINGLVVIGRMFDTPVNAGKVFSSLVGSLVLISYETDYFGGSLGLAIKSLSGVPTEEAVNYEDKFVGKYNLAEAKLAACNSLLATRTFSNELNTFRMTYCNLQVLINYSDERIHRGLKGYVLSIIHKILLACSEVSDEAIIAFLYAIITEFNTSRSADCDLDDSKMLFIASMMDKRVETAMSHLPILSAKISEFAALFANAGHVISADSFLLYSMYNTLCEASNIEVVESQLPVQGYCVYKNYTVRRD